jgi:Tol biopolymer transport system component
LADERARIATGCRVRIVDEGKERPVTAGFIDILAEDDQGSLVVTELKAGEAPDSAATQVLSYLGSLKGQSGDAVRGILVARSFSPRVKLAPRVEYARQSGRALPTRRRPRAPAVLPQVPEGRQLDGAVWRCVSAHALPLFGSDRRTYMPRIVAATARRATTVTRNERDPALFAPRMRKLVALAACVAALAGVIPVSAHANTSPLGTIAFSSYRCDDGGFPAEDPFDFYPEPNCRPSIFRMNSDGSDVRRLTNGAAPEDDNGSRPLSGDYSPTWSPLGDRIAFSRQTAESYGYNRLFVMNADGSGQHRLMPGAPAGYGDMQNPVWSPIGPEVAFEAVGFATGEPQTHAIFDSRVFVVNSITGEVRPLSDPSMSANMPVFSGDGRSVTYWGMRHDEGYQQLEFAMYRTNLDGGITQQLSLGDQSLLNNVSFSPDGEYAAVTLPNGRLYTMRADGRRLTRRSKHSAVPTMWSPVGRTLFFTANPSGDDRNRARDLWRLDLGSGVPPKRLTRAGGGSFSPRSPSRAKRMPADTLAPAVAVGTESVATHAKPASSVRGAGFRADRVPFYAVDPSGLRSVYAELARRSGHGRCRFVDARGHLGSGRPCRSHGYARVRSYLAWQRRTGRLKSGTYQLRLRVTDRRGNTTRRPRLHLVRVR